MRESRIPQAKSKEHRVKAKAESLLLPTRVPESACPVCPGHSPGEPVEGVEGRARLFFLHAALLAASP